MKVESARSAFLSDWEVLDFMREMDPKSSKAAAAGVSVASVVEQAGAESSERNAAGSTADEADEKAMRSLPPNLRTIQYAVSESLSDLHRPCAHQTVDSIPNFLDALSLWERGQPVPGLNDDEHPPRAPIDKDKRLTKGERLMVVNLAPDQRDILSAIVEEVFERFTDEETYDLICLISLYLPVNYADIHAIDARLYGNGDEQAQDVAAAGDEMVEDVHVIHVAEEGAHPGEEIGATAGYDDDEGIVDQDMDEDEGGDGEGAVDDVPDDD